MTQVPASPSAIGSTALSRAVAAIAIAASVLLGMLGVKPASASAAAEWRIGVGVGVAGVAGTGALQPGISTRVAPGETFTYVFTAENVGDAASDGGGSLDVTLPSGMTAVSVTNQLGFAPAFNWSCNDPSGTSSLHCEVTVPVPAGGRTDEQVLLAVTTAPGASGELAAELSLTGGGATSSAVTKSVIASAVPDFGISSFDGAVLDGQGAALTQAGGHPETASASFALNRRIVNDGVFPDGGGLRDASVELPAGFIGNPAAVPGCPKNRRIPTEIEAKNPSAVLTDFCSRDHIVGRVIVTVNMQDHVRQFAAPVYRLEPPPGVAAHFGFSFANQRTFLDAVVRNDGDYGVNVRTRNATQALPVLGSVVTLWGVPADPSHDARRCFFFEPVNGDAAEVPDCDPASPYPLLRPGSTDNSQLAFITNPTQCTPTGVGLPTQIDVRSWHPDGEQDTASFVSHHPPGFPLPMDQWGAPVGPTGCDALPFDPSMTVTPDSSAPDAPAGLAFDLSFPTEGLTNASGLSQAHLKRASVTLPEGLTISPSAADGLAACSDAESGVGTAGAANCPEASKVGTVEATTPLLEETLTGGVYIGSQKSGDPASGEMFRLFLVLDNDERGIHVKLPGQVRVNPDTGRIETVFDNNPQVPVERLSLRLKSGPRAPLAMPTTCGPKSIDAVFESWGGQIVTRSDSFTVDCPGQTGFAPGFEAGSLSPTGGAFSPFVASITRPDRQQFLSGVRVDLPKGLIAKLRGVPLCDSAHAANGGCPDGSRIGTATVAAGPGSNPFQLQGPVYLTEGYKGGPYGLSVQVAVKAGPFDLGTVIVRQAIHVDPRTAELSVVSDPLPQIVKGVPVRLRSATVDVDREGFAINPTSCGAKQVRATLTSIDGAVHETASRFQASDCQALAFKPRLAMRLSGRRQLRTGGHPGLRATLRQSAGQANIAATRVALPTSMALDPRNSTDPKLVCDYDRAQTADCPATSVIGRATARTPVLNRPLSGPVHLVQGIRFGPSGNRIRTTPTLLVKLRGEVAIDLRARTTVERNRLVTVFDDVPDAPVSRFDLTISGGKRKGILVVTRTRRAKIDLCATGRRAAGVQTAGQNGKRASFATRLRAPCAKTGAARRAAGRSRHGRSR